MADEVVATRFGRERPTRIATSTTMLLEAADMPLTEPRYQLMIPFNPAIVSGASTAATTASSEPNVWSSQPERLDLSFYQGDDVRIPLFFRDADMSDDEEWTWRAQMRVRHHYLFRLVSEFSIDSEYQEPTLERTYGQTLVSLLLPRSVNRYAGVFHWDLQSTSPFVSGLDPSTYLPVPTDVDAEDWPPATQTHTWLYGVVRIVPRVTATDVLPPPVTNIYTGTSMLTSTSTGTYGPNGRVP